MGGIKLGDSGIGNKAGSTGLTPMRAVKAVNTLGASELDAATGNNVGNAITKIAGDLDPTKKPNYGSVNAPDPSLLQHINAAQYAMPKDLKAAQIDPSVGAINMSPQDQFRAQQLQLTNQLSQQAQGIGPSVAQNQLRQGESANLAATMAQLASARGGANPGLARQALQTSANIQNQTNQAAATQRLQEQMQAAGLLGNVAQGARGQDIGLAQQQAANNLAIGQQNAQMQQSFQGLQQQYMAMGLSAEQANQQAALQFAGLQQGTDKANQASQQAAEAARRQAIGKIVNAGGAQAAQVMGMPPAAGQVM